MPSKNYSLNKLPQPYDKNKQAEERKNFFFKPHNTFHDILSVHKHEKFTLKKENKAEIWEGGGGVVHLLRSLLFKEEGLKLHIWMNIFVEGEG